MEGDPDRRGRSRAWRDPAPRSGKGSRHASDFRGKGDKYGIMQILDFWTTIHVTLVTSVTMRPYVTRHSTITDHLSNLEAGPLDEFRLVFLINDLLLSAALPRKKPSESESDFRIATLTDLVDFGTFKKPGRRLED